MYNNYDDLFMYVQLFVTRALNVFGMIINFWVCS